MFNIRADYHTDQHVGFQLCMVSGHFDSAPGGIAYCSQRCRNATAAEGLCTSIRAVLRGCGVLAIVVGIEHAGPILLGAASRSTATVERGAARKPGGGLIDDRLQASRSRRACGTVEPGGDVLVRQDQIRIAALGWRFEDLLPGLAAGKEDGGAAQGGRPDHAGFAFPVALGAGAADRVLAATHGHFHIGACLQQQWRVSGCKQVGNGDLSAVA